MAGYLLGGVIEIRSSLPQLHGIFQIVPPKSNLPLWTGPMWGLGVGLPPHCSPSIKGRGFKSGRILGSEAGPCGLRQGSTGTQAGRAHAREDTSLRTKEGGVARSPPAHCCPPAHRSPPAPSPGAAAPVTRSEARGSAFAQNVTFLGHLRSWLKCSYIELVP